MLKYKNASPFLPSATASFLLLLNTLLWLLIGRICTLFFLFSHDYRLLITKPLFFLLKVTYKEKSSLVQKGRVSVPLLSLLFWYETIETYTVVASQFRCIFRLFSLTFCIWNVC